MIEGKAQFYGVRAAAANIECGKGDYTKEMFQQDFPQFYKAATQETPSVCWVPPAMLEEIIKMANVSVCPERWLESWRYAAGLYVAHYATLYLRSYAESSSTPAKAAATGALVGVVSSATLGDSSVSYDTAAVTKGTEEWGDLNSTTYGQMLANRAKLIGMGGSYIL